MLYKKATAKCDSKCMKLTASCLAEFVFSCVERLYISVYSTYWKSSQAEKIILSYKINSIKPEEF